MAVTARQLGAGRRQPEFPSPARGILPGVAGLPPATDDPDYPPPVWYRQYALTELARGGVGTIYRSVHPQTGRVYAIKQLNPQFSNDPVVVEAFHRGARTLMSVRHPSIVKVYYDWEERNESGVREHFVIMEFLPGETLHDLIRRASPLRMDERLLETVRQAAEAVHYLHSRDIIHRDIKPENFRLADARYKLLDFDTVIPRAQRAFLSQDGLPVGTPEYMSPEQARGSPDIDFRADVYSFGMMVYELLTGAVPFTGAPSRVLIDQMETLPRNPRTYNEQLQPAVAEVLLMSLQKDRERRFQSIPAFIAALQNACALGGSGEASTADGSVGR